MKLHRIFAIILRYLFLFKHSLDRLSDAFYWPTIDILLWGLTSLYFQKFTPNASIIVLVLMSGILLWLIVWRGQYEITVNILEDLWNKNLINIFVSPLKFSEWVVSFFLIGIGKAIVSLAFASTLAYFLYKFNLFVYGFYMIPYFILLILTGWWIGCFVAGTILRFGTRVQTMAWTAVALLSPFSAVYYPLNILPTWAQKVAAIIPTSYIFEGSREVLTKGYFDINKVIISLVLNIVYLTLAIYYLRKSFDKILDKGLVKLY